MDKETQEKGRQLVVEYLTAVFLETEGVESTDSTLSHIPLHDILDADIETLHACLRYAIGLAVAGVTQTATAKGFSTLSFWQSYLSNTGESDA